MRDGSLSQFFTSRFMGNAGDRSRLDRMDDWSNETARRYQQVLDELEGPGPGCDDD